VSRTKNTDYVIYMTTSGGRTWRYLKDGSTWKQMGPEGQMHRMTAEQVLNHLLPALARIKRVAVRVDYKQPRKRKPV
jgi:hypothetical protein